MNDNFFDYLKDMINYKIFFCSKIVLKSNLNDYLNNLGFYLGAFVFVFNIINFIIFYFSFVINIRKKLSKYVPNKVYLYRKAKEYKRKLSKRKMLSNPKIKKNNNIKKKNIHSIRKTTEQQTMKYKQKKINIFTGQMESNKLISFSNIKEMKEKINKIEENIVLNYDEEIDENEYNSLPYSQARRLDKRNIFIVYLSLVKMKIDILTIIFYPEDFTHRSLLLSVYALNFLFNYFMNALLYSDNVVSQKYHNNGGLHFATSFSLSLASNIITGFIVWIIKKLTNYHEFLQLIVKNVYSEKIFLLLFKKNYRIMKIKIFIYIF